MSDVDLVVRGGTVVTAGAVQQADIAIRDGRIVAIGRDLGVSDEEIDARGKLVLPGGVDSHCHIEETMGPVDAGDTFASATASAAAGGTTTVISFAGQPGSSLKDNLASAHARAAAGAHIDYSFHLIVSDSSDAGLEALRAAIAEGHRSLKIFLTYGELALDDAAVLRVLALARSAGALVTVHAENNAAVAYLTTALERAGLTQMRCHSWARPMLVEREACHRVIALAELLDTPIQIFHVTGAESAAEIERAQARGVKVFAETCPQYLFLTTDDLDKPGFEGAKFLCSPPPRTAADQDALWRHIQRGTLGVVSSDHAATRYDDPLGKMLNGADAPFSAVPNGVPGLETRLPLLFSEGVVAGRIDLETFVAVTSTNPAKLFGLYPRKGTIAVGADADLVLWETERLVTIRNTMLHHAIDYTPYEGRQITGWPMTTISRGRIVVSDGKLVGQPGHGRFLARQPYDYIRPAGRHIIPFDPATGEAIPD